MIFFEAINTLASLGKAFFAWFLVGVAALTVVLLAGTAVGAWAVRGLWRLLYARLSAEHAPQAPESTPSPKRRHTPSWALPDPNHHQDAA